jgi:hypothetical protein
VLTREQRVMWAEVVACDPKAGSNDDYKARQQGNMAIRLLSKMDCFLLPEADMLLVEGNPVGIIDMRVFVPEVVYDNWLCVWLCNLYKTYLRVSQVLFVYVQVLPVLSTFARLVDKPELGRMPFLKRITGAAPPPPVPDAILVEAKAHDVIANAVRQSSIDIVRRLDDNKREHLVQAICKLTKDANLYGTQLEAFAAALGSPVHCIQGPPGTGKVNLHFTFVFLFIHSDDN